MVTDKALDKEILNIKKEEAKRKRIALKTSNVNIKAQIEEKIPEKVFVSLQKAFAKSFEIVFEKGVGVIEKTYNKEELLREYELSDYAVSQNGDYRDFRNLHSGAKSSGRTNMLISTVEGSVLGALGIGIPDIILFTGMMLKGAYEISLSYGYEYKDDIEKYLILKIMECAFTKGNDYVKLNENVNEIIDNELHVVPTTEDMKNQITRTANAMATDMLVIKFIQGLPIVGILGGMMNPVYYRKITGYMQLKYKRRYIRTMYSDDDTIA